MEVDPTCPPRVETSCRATTELACTGERQCLARIAMARRVETEHASYSCAHMLKELGRAGRRKEVYVLQGPEREGAEALGRALPGRAAAVVVHQGRWGPLVDVGPQVRRCIRWCGDVCVPLRAVHDQCVLPHAV